MKKSYSKIILHPDHAEVELTQGFWAKIDLEDVDQVKSYTWFYTRDGAKTNSRAKGSFKLRESERREGTTILMHRMLTNCPGDQYADHLNQDMLDNRRVNLRLLSVSQTLASARKREGTISRFRGVTFDKRKGLWRAQIGHDKKNFSLGYHTTEESAARAYNKAALETFGEFAQLNQISVT